MSRRRGLVAVLGPAAALVAAAALLLAGVRPAPDPVPAPAPVSRTVSASTAVCAAFPLGDRTAGGAPSKGTPTDVAAVAPERGGASPPGSFEVAARGAARPLLSLGRRGRWQSATLPVARAGDLLTRSSGALGTGASAFAGQRLPDDVGAGLAVQRCPAPARQWWFVGAGSSVERESTLVLSDPDRGDAVVDLSLRGPDGPIETAGTAGIRIPAGGRAALPLAGLVAGEDEVSVEVDATQGQVVAAVADDWSGLDAAGSDWLPAASPPARSVLLPGVLDAGDRSRLIVANASDSATPVEVSLVTADGSFVPAPAPRVLAPAGGVVSVRLPDVGDGAAVRVQAENPVSAAVRVDSGADVAYAVQGPALVGPAVLPVDLGPSTDGTHPRVQLAVAPAAGAASRAARTPPARTATLAAYDRAGTELARTAVTVAAGTASIVDPDRDLALDTRARSAVAYLVVTPDPAGHGSGRLLGTAVLGDAGAGGAGGGVALLPLDPGLTQVEVPVLTPSVVAGPG